MTNRVVRSAALVASLAACNASSSGGQIRYPFEGFYVRMTRGQLPPSADCRPADTSDVALARNPGAPGHGLRASIVESMTVCMAGDSIRLLVYRDTVIEFSVRTIGTWTTPTTAAARWRVTTEHLAASWGEPESSRVDPNATVESDGSSYTGSRSAWPVRDHIFAAFSLGVYTYPSLQKVSFYLRVIDERFRADARHR